MSIYKWHINFQTTTKICILSLRMTHAFLCDIPPKTQLYRKNNTQEKQINKKEAQQYKWITICVA